jgi:hypothetical protein
MYTGYCEETSTEALLVASTENGLEDNDEGNTWYLYPVNRVQEEMTTKILVINTLNKSLHLERALTNQKYKHEGINSR